MQLGREYGARNEKTEMELLCDWREYLMEQTVANARRGLCREIAEEKRLAEDTITWAIGTPAFSELPPKPLARVAPQSLCERTYTDQMLQPLERHNLPFRSPMST